MHKRKRDMILRLKQVVSPNITMMKIDNDKHFWRGVTKKYLEVLGISNNDIDEILEEIHKRDNVDKKVGIEGDVDGKYLVNLDKSKDINRD